MWGGSDNKILKYISKLKRLNNFVFLGNPKTIKCLTQSVKGSSAPQIRITYFLTIIHFDSRMVFSKFLAFHSCNQHLKFIPFLNV